MSPVIFGVSLVVWTIVWFAVGGALVAIHHPAYFDLASVLLPLVAVAVYLGGMWSVFRFRLVRKARNLSGSSASYVNANALFEKQRSGRDVQPFEDPFRALFG